MQWNKAKRIDKSNKLYYPIKEEPKPPLVTRNLAKKKIPTEYFKLRDPATGLFYVNSHSNYDHNLNFKFDRAGSKWALKSTTVATWADYELRRHRFNLDLPDLELVRFEIAITEKETSTDTISNMKIAAAYQNMDHITNKYGYEFREFVAKLPVKFPDYEFTHIVIFESDDETLERLEEIPEYKFAFIQSGDKNGIYYAAINGIRDVIYMKMALSDSIIEILSNDDVIREYEHFSELNAVVQSSLLV